MRHLELGLVLILGAVSSGFAGESDPPLTPAVFAGSYELESLNLGSCHSYLDVEALPKGRGVRLRFSEPDGNLTVAPVTLKLGKSSRWLGHQDARILSEGRWSPDTRKLVYYDAFMENCDRYPFLGTKCKGDRTIHETQLKLSVSQTLLTYTFQRRVFLDPLVDAECEYRRR